MGAWICPTCRLHYGDEARRRCPADGARLVLNLSGASVQGHILTHLLHVGPDGSTLWEATGGANERVALMLLRGEHDADAWALARQLDHPNVARLKDYAPVDEDLACVVMEWIDGKPLTEHLVQGPLPLPIALQIADRILDGLEHVHAQGMVHGDVQVATVFVGPQTTVKLLDVGVHRWPPVVELVGTGGAKALEQHMVTYAPPERLALGEMGPQGDLYSVAALLWHLIVGTPPFGTDPHRAARAHLTAPRPRLSRVRPDVAWPEGLEAFLERAMASQPARRFADAAQMRAALQPILQASKKVTTAPPIVAAQSAPPSAPVAGPRAPDSQLTPITRSPARVAAPDDEVSLTTLYWVAGVGAVVLGLIFLVRSIDSRSDTRVLPNPGTTVRTPKAEDAPIEAVELVEATPTPVSGAPASRAPASAASSLSIASVAAPESGAPVSGSALASVGSEAIAAAPPSAALASRAPASAPPSAPATEVAAPRTAAPASVASAAPETEPPAPKAAPKSTAAPAQIADADPPKRAVARPPKPTRKAVRKRAERKRPKRVAKRTPKATPKSTVDAAKPPKATKSAEKNRSERGIKLLGLDDD